MSQIEDRLRDAFRADAQMIVAISGFDPGAAAARHDRAPSGSVAAGGRRRGGIFVPLAAAVAVVAVAVASIAIVPKLWPGKDSTEPSATVPLTAAFPGGRVPAAVVPGFVVAVISTAPYAGAYATTLRVIDTATGHVTGSLAPPRPGLYFQAVAAAGSDREFVAAATSSKACQTSFYRFRLTAQGQPAGLAPLAVPPVPGRPAGQFVQQSLESPIGQSTLAVSLDLSKLAYVTTKCTRGSTRKYAGQVGVVNLHTGKVRTWRYLYPASPTSLSLSADGSELQMSTTASRPVRGESFNQGIWLLRTGSPAGPLARHYREVRRPGIDTSQASALSPTGAVTLGSGLRYYRSRPDMRVPISAYATSSGKLIRVPHVFPQLGFAIGPSLSLSASGRYLLLYDWENGLRVHDYRKLEILDVATGRYLIVPGNAVRGVQDVAW